MNKNSTTFPLTVVGFDVSYAAAPWCANSGPETIRKPTPTQKRTISLFVIPGLRCHAHPIMCVCRSWYSCSIKPPLHNAGCSCNQLPPHLLYGDELLNPLAGCNLTGIEVSLRVHGGDVQPVELPGSMARVTDSAHHRAITAVENPHHAVHHVWYANVFLMRAR